MRFLFCLFLSLIVIPLLKSQIPQHSSIDIVVEAMDSSGIVDTIPYRSMTNFGVDLLEDVEGDAVWAYDMTDSLFCSGTVINDITGKIALIRRGGCDFSLKIWRAQEAGAIGVIIVNHYENDNEDDNTLVGMFGGDAADLVTIPAIFVSRATGELLASELSTGNRIVISFNLKRIEGIFTIGGNSPDFETFAAATTTLNRALIIGEVIFNVRTGIYEEQVEIYELNGVDSLNRVTFQSEVGDNSQVVLTHNSSVNTVSHTLKLNNASWITFRGMTIQKMDSPNANVVSIEQNCHDLLFQNNALIGFPGFSFASPTIIEFDGYFDYDRNNCRFINNHFVNGHYGILAGNYAEGWIIEDNVFTGQYKRAISLSQKKNIKIKGNTIRSESDFYRYGGIYLGGCEDTVIITGNDISFPSGAGIYLTHTMNSPETATLISNNTIQELDSSEEPADGLLITNNDQIHIYHNTIKMYREDSPVLNLSDCQNVIWKNNIFHKETGKTVDLTNCSMLEADYNNYSNNRVIDDSMSLLDWQVMTGLDIHSMTNNPLFLNAESFLPLQAALNAAAIPITSIVEDIEGNPRHPQTPDIGAYEFFLQDLALLQLQSSTTSCELSTTESITIQIKNNSEIATLNNFQIAYQLDDQDILSEIVEVANFSPQTTLDYTLQNTLNLSEIGTHQLSIYVDYENDFVRQNDTLHTTIYNYAKDTTYLYELTCDPTAVTSTETLLQNQYNCDSLIIDSTILDNLPPVANCKNLNLDLASHEAIHITAADLNDNSTDNCQVMDLSSNITSFDCEQLGENTVTLTVTDAANNQATCTSIVTLHDTGLPRADCINFLEIALLAEEAYLLEASTLNANSQDYCTASEDLILSFSPFDHRSSLEIDCDDIGIERFELWVTDEAGNQDHCVVNVEIQKGDRDCTCDEENIIFENENIPPATYKAAFQIEAAGRVTSNDPNLATIFSAGESISLLPGFEVVLGSPFVADIETCFINETLIEHTEEVNNRSTHDVFNTEKVALKVVPNPFKKEAIIQYEIGVGQAVEISLFSISGKFLKLVQSKTWQEKGQYNITLAGEELEAGIYLLQWQSVKHRVVEKVIVR